MRLSREGAKRTSKQREAVSINAHLWVPSKNRGPVSIFFRALALSSWTSLRSGTTVTHYEHLGVLWWWWGALCSRCHAVSPTVLKKYQLQLPCDSVDLFECLDSVQSCSIHWEIGAPNGVPWERIDLMLPWWQTNSNAHTVLHRLTMEGGPTSPLCLLESSNTSLK